MADLEHLLMAFIEAIAMTVVSLIVLTNFIKPFTSYFAQLRAIMCRFLWCVHFLYTLILP